VPGQRHPLARWFTDRGSRKRACFKRPSGPVTPDYRRGIEDAARMMEEWAIVAKGEKRIAYDNARIGILAMLGQMERSTK
jgi:hypothetical protein